MFALDDLLGLLGHTVELHVLGSLFEVLDFQVEFLLLVANLFETGFEFRDGLELFDLGVATLHDFFVFIVDGVSLNKDGIFVISSNR